MEQLIYETTAITTFIESFKSVTSGCVSFFSEKASIEKEYGNKLRNLSLNPFGKLLQRNRPQDQLSTGMKTAINTLFEQNKLLADQHINSAKFIEETIIKPLKLTSSQVESKAHLVLKEINRKIKQHTDMINTVNRIKENKQKAHKELSEIKDKMRGKSGKTYQKMNSKQEQLTDNIKKYANDLQNGVRIANKIRENVYGNEMKELLKQIETVTCEWNTMLRNLLTLYHDVDISLLKTKSQYCLAVQQTINAIDWEKDLNEFVEKWNGVHSVDPIELTTEDLIIDNEDYEENILNIMTNGEGTVDVHSQQCGSSIRTPSTR